jgi:hypothetical protein
MSVGIAAILFVVAISKYPIHSLKEVLVLGWLPVGAAIAAVVALFAKPEARMVSPD